MYVIELSESKYDSLVEHIGKGLKCLGKAMQCLEELNDSEDDSNADDEYIRSEYMNRNNRSHNRMHSRYSRY